MMDPKIEKQLRDIAWLAAEAVPITIGAATATAILDEITELRRENTRLMSLVGEAMNPPTGDYRAEVIAAHLWLTQAGVPSAHTLAERVKALVAERDELTKQLGWERDHSKMLSEGNARLHREKADAEAFCAKVRGQYTEAIRERDAACSMHELATQHAVDAKAHAEQRRLERDNALAVIGRMEPLRTALRSWDWNQLLEDERIPDEAVMPLLRAFAWVEAEENKAKQAKEEADRG